MRPSHDRTVGTGFTLIEIVIAIGIIGLAVTALMAVCGSCTRATNGGNKLLRAVFLAQELREWTLRLPLTDPDEADWGNPPGPDGVDPQVDVDDLDDLMGVTYSPARSGQGSPIADMAGWSETITLTWLDPATLTPVQPGNSDVVRVEANIGFDGREVYTTSWLAAGR